MNDIKHGSFQGTSWSKEGTGSPVILVHGLGTVSYTHLTLPTICSV